MAEISLAQELIRAIDTVDGSPSTALCRAVLEGTSRADARARVFFYRACACLFVFLRHIRT